MLGIVRIVRALQEVHGVPASEGQAGAPELLWEVLLHHGVCLKHPSDGDMISGEAVSCLFGLIACASCLISLLHHVQGC